MASPVTDLRTCRPRPRSEPAVDRQGFPPGTVLVSATTHLTDATHRPPAVDGPNDIDRANRTSPTAPLGSCGTRVAGPGERSVVDEIAGAARASFAGVARGTLGACWRSPSAAAVVGSLLTQELVRSLHALEIVGTLRRRHSSSSWSRRSSITRSSRRFSTRMRSSGTGSV